MLTRGQLDHFDTFGFVVIRAALGSEETVQLQNNAQRRTGTCSTESCDVKTAPCVSFRDHIDLRSTIPSCRFARHT